MALNIIELIKGQLGPALISQAATQLGESESGISKAISGLIPSVLGGLANHSEDSSVLSAVTTAASSGLLGNLLGGTTGNSLVSGVLDKIFGDKIGALIGSIAGFSGISESSANSLLNTVTGASLGSVGKYAQDQGLDAQGISSLLNDQKGVVSSLLPAGLSLASLGLGDSVIPDLGASVDPAAPVPPVTPVPPATPVDTSPKVEVTREGSTHVSVEPKKDSGILKWLLPLVLLLAAGYFLFKQCDNKETQMSTMSSDSLMLEEDTMTLVTDSLAMTPVSREATTVTLPDGTTLNAYKGGIEDRVVQFLNSQEYAGLSDDQLKERWFNFDNLNFEFGTTTLTAESKAQLDNLNAILKAYPQAKIKIGAYTDKKGDDAFNKKLSQDRADAVEKALASSQVEDAEGYGEEFATVAETATDQERESDRKTAIRFVK